MRLKSILLAAAATFMLASCSTNKRSPLPYFMDVDGVEQGLPLGSYTVKIEPSDELYITINSIDPNATAAYNLPASNPAVASNLDVYTNPRQQTYIVDSKGYIEMPILGKVRVEGLTVEELTSKLENMVSHDVKDPVVRVELMNFKINIAGEVNRPGTQNISRARYSILDAISQAGDLTIYGERDNVLVVREENGKRFYERINLNSADAMNSPFFYLKQNDFVYVTPNKIRQDNSKYNQNNAFKLSVISTIVSASSVIASLVIALTIK